MSVSRIKLNFWPARTVSRRALAVLGLLVAVLMLAILAYLDASQTVALRRAEKKQREVSQTVVVEAPRLSVEDAKVVRLEIKAVNRQIRQLNQSWDVLLGDLRSYPGGVVRLLALEVDAHSGSIRVVGVAANTEAMTDYAAYLADQKSLREVLISHHEIDANGVRFVVDGKWAEKL